MRKRGRKSPGDLMALALGIPPRPPVPAGLDDQEAELWLAISGSLPSDHLRPEHVPLVEAMVRHIIAGRRVSGMIGEVEKSMLLAGAEADRDRVEVLLAAVPVLEKLYKMRDTEIRAASSLATRLRCTPQTIYDRTKLKPTIPLGPKPWEL